MGDRQAHTHKQITLDLIVEANITVSTDDDRTLGDEKSLQ